MKTITIRLNDREEIMLTELKKYYDSLAPKIYKDFTTSEVIRFLINDAYQEIKQNNR